MTVRGFWRRSRGGDAEAGATSVMLVMSIVVIAAVAGALLLPWGSFLADRREASTASDAAALAAVSVWRDRLEGVHGEMRGAASEEVFWGPVGRGLGTFVPGALARARAEEMAARNNAEVIGYSVNGARGTVTVRVRSLDTVPGTSQRAEAESTARLDFRSGLCVGSGRLGVLIHGSCRTGAPPPPPPPVEIDPEESPDPDLPQAPEPPYEIPNGTEEFGIVPVLTTGR